MKKLSYYLTPVILLCSVIVMSLVLFYSFYGVYSTAIQEMRPLMDFAPSIFTGLITYLLVNFMLYNAFVRKSKGLLTKIYLTALAVVELLLVLLFFLHSSFHFAGYYNRTLFFLLINIFNIAVLGFWLYAIYRKRGTFFTKMMEGAPKLFANLPVHVFIRYSIIAVFALGALGDILPAIFRFSYYRIEPLWYPVLLLSMILPTLSLTLELRNRYRKDTVRPYINLVANIVFFALLFNMIVNTNALALTAQNIFYLDFAATMFVFPYVLLLMNLYFIGYSIYSLLLKNRKKEVTTSE